MVRRERKRLGVVQFRIMEVLWRQGRSTAKEITADLSRRSPIALSTVQTLLRTLEAKKLVDHRREGRAFVFRPLVSRDEILRFSTRDLLTRLFGGSAFSLVAHLLQHRMVSKDDLERIKQLIAEREGEAE